MGLPASAGRGGIFHLAAEPHFGDLERSGHHSDELEGHEGLAGLPGADCLLRHADHFADLGLGEAEHFACFSECFVHSGHTGNSTESDR